MPQYVLPDLDYDFGALEPHISGQIMELHHGKHHKAYVDKANETLEQLAQAREDKDFSRLAGLERALAFNLSGHVLHSIFWKNLKPRGGDVPSGELARAITRDFGSFESFKAQMTEVAATIMGSGWAALVWEPMAQRLLTCQIYDHQSNLSQGGFAADGDRRLGARVLSPVQEREGGVLQGGVEPLELGRRQRPPGVCAQGGPATARHRRAGGSSPDVIRPSAAR